jgi:hypothetical protein
LSPAFSKSLNGDTAKNNNFSSRKIVPKKKNYKYKDDISVLQDGTAGTDSVGTDHRVGRYGKNTGSANWGVKG